MNTAQDMKLDHIVILLANLKAGLPFYETLLPLIGFSKTGDHVFGNTEEIYLDFRQSGKPDQAYERHAPGLNHMGFTATNRDAIERVGKAMAAAGFEVPAIQEFPDGSAMFLRDPEGMRIEIASYTNK